MVLTQEELKDLKMDTLKNYLTSECGCIAGYSD